MKERNIFLAGALAGVLILGVIASVTIITANSISPSDKVVTIYTPNDIYFFDVCTNSITTESGKHNEHYRLFQTAADSLKNYTTFDANQPTGCVYNDVDAIIGSLNGDQEIDSVVYHYIHLYNITDSTLIREILDTYYL